MQTRERIAAGRGRGRESRLGRGRCNQGYDYDTACLSSMLQSMLYAMPMLHLRESSSLNLLVGLRMATLIAHSQTQASNTAQQGGNSRMDDGSLPLFSLLPTHPSHSFPLLLTLLTHLALFSSASHGRQSTPHPTSTRPSTTSDDGRLPCIQPGISTSSGCSSIPPSPSDQGHDCFQTTVCRSSACSLSALAPYPWMCFFLNPILDSPFICFLL